MHIYIHRHTDLDIDLDLDIQAYRYVDIRIYRCKLMGTRQFPETFGWFMDHPEPPSSFHEFALGARKHLQRAASHQLSFSYDCRPSNKCIVYVCAYVCVYIYVHAHVCIPIFISVHMDVFISLFIYLDMYMISYPPPSKIRTIYGECDRIIAWGS